MSLKVGFGYVVLSLCVLAGGFNCLRLSCATHVVSYKTAPANEVEQAASVNGKLASVGEEGFNGAADNRVTADDDEILLRGLQISSNLNFSKEDRLSLLRKGAEAIRRWNPDLLLIHQAFKNGENLHCLIKRPHSKDLRKKTMFKIAVGKQCEMWIHQLCRRTRTAFVGAYTGPLLVLMSALDQPEQTMREDKAFFKTCFSSSSAQSGMDMVVWNLQRFCNLRQGVHDDNENCGFCIHKWTSPERTALSFELQSVEGPSISDTAWRSRTLLGRSRTVLFHLSTGLCVNKVNVNGLEVSSCDQASNWKLTPQGLLVLDSTYLVIGAQGPEQTAVLELQGTQGNGPWNVSKNRVQVSTMLTGQLLCLDAPRAPVLLTNPCTCRETFLSSMNPWQCDSPAVSQRFVFISTSD